MRIPLLIRVLLVITVIAAIDFGYLAMVLSYDVILSHAIAYACVALGLILIIGINQKRLLNVMSAMDADRSSSAGFWSTFLFDEQSAVRALVSRSQGLVVAQRELTRAVAHELRTPVARIRFGLERVLASIADPVQQVQRVTAMERDIAELERLIEEILLYARLDDSAPPLIMQRTCLGTLLEGIAEDAKNLGSAKTVELDNVFDDDIWVEAEPLYLQRAIHNLVGNAMKYSHANVRIFCDVGVERVSIIVDDDGPGIAPENRLQIFETFMRLDGSRSRTTGGHGLGLAIVKRVARWHGGDVLVSTSPIGGARFSFSVRRLSAA